MTESPDDIAQGHVDAHRIEADVREGLTEPRNIEVKVTYVGDRQFSVAAMRNSDGKSLSMSVGVPAGAVQRAHHVVLMRISQFFTAPRTLTQREEHLAHLLVEANRELAKHLFPGRVSQLSTTAECRMVRICISYDDAEDHNNHFHAFTAAVFASPETIAAAAYNHFLLCRNSFTATDSFGEDIAEAMTEGIEYMPADQTASVRHPNTRGMCPVYVEDDASEAGEAGAAAPPKAYMQ